MYCKKVETKNIMKKKLCTTIPTVINDADISVTLVASFNSAIAVK